jgi:Lon protease-like protein
MSGRSTPKAPPALDESPPPAVLPVFPLTGSLLLPGNWLPLNIFETRYRNMVEDAMKGERYLGMIQPVVPQQDNWPALEPPEETPRLYSIGCAGRIESCEPQSDGRYVILLKGYVRFRVREELAPVRGYRRVAAEYDDFAADRTEPQAQIEPGPLLQAVRAFGKAQGLSFDLDVLAALPGVSLLNGLAVALPFRPAEKQALLEAPDPRQRQEMLLTLMGMGIELPDAGDYYSPPTVN